MNALLALTSLLATSVFAGPITLTPSASVPAVGVSMGSGATIGQIVASSLAGATGEKVTETTGAKGCAHVFTVPAGQFWPIDFFAFKVNAGRIGVSNLKIIRYDQGFTTNSAYSTVLADHTYSGAEVQTANNDYLYYEFAPITLTGGARGTTYALAFSNDQTSVELKAYLDTTDAYPSGYFGRDLYPTITASTRDFNFALGKSGAASLETVVFNADFNAATPVSGSVTANATAANLNAGTSVGSWLLPNVTPGAIISNSGNTDNAFMFDRVVAGTPATANTASARFSRSVDLAGGERMILEMDLYAARQANNQRIEFSLDDAAGKSAYTFVFRMNNYKDFYTLNASGQLSTLSTNPTQFQYLNPAVNAYRNWGTTMQHVKAEISSQPTQAGNRGAKLSIDWNGDGDYNDPGELIEAKAGPRSSGASEISALRFSNLTSVAGGAWIDNISVKASPGSVFAHNNHFNLAKFQTSTADSADTSEPVQYANDGMVAQDSRWATGTAAPHWLAINLATPMTIGSAHLFSGTPTASTIADITLQYKDGANWVNIPGATVSSNTAPALNIVFDSPVTAREFRLYTNDGAPRVKELALYPPTADGSLVPFGSDLDLNAAKLRQYVYSSVSGSNYPKLAIDGYADDTSAWASANTAGPHDLQIDLQQSEAINGIQLYSGYSGQPGTQIQNFEVAYDNGSGWVLFDGGSVTGNTRLNRTVRFNTSVVTKTIRIRSLDANQAFIREFVILPDDGGAGYPLWTDVINAAPPNLSFLKYEDSYHTIQNRAAGTNLQTSTTGSSLTTATPQFQVLLNIGTDTYRLRSRDSGRCFEAALASTTAGAAIVEGTYSSMPHQRWRLEDTGDATHFRIVNVWSGLVLGLDGTNVVQQVANTDQTQHWKINYQTHFPKKGQASHFHFSQMFKPSWAYRWTYDDEATLNHGQFMPMQWGSIASDTAGILRYQPTWYGRANQTSVLGFNEPDLHDQANMTEATAAYQWPRLERMRLPLVGPVPANYQGAWRQAYEAMAAERGLRSEYMALHWYSISGAATGSPSTLINNMQSLYNTYGKPIWLTEFSTRDFVGDKTTWSRNHNYNFLAEFAWRAESLPWLKKWSLFEWGIAGGDPATTDASSDDPADMNSPRLSLHYNNDSTNPGFEDLAECGLFLAGWDGDITIRDETSYIIHNKARFLRLIDNPGSPTVTHANVLHRSSTEQFIFQPAPNGRKYIVGITDGRRLSYNGSAVGLAAAGTTGTSVEWSLEEKQYGWFYINHPSTGKRLRITNGDVIDVDANTATSDNVQFRFIKPALPTQMLVAQTLPYAESFEQGIGAWVQSWDDDYDWRLNSGGTPTASAGPSGASDGARYLYAEGHDASTGYKTTMVECKFDFSGLSNVELTFDYHMYGVYIDFLSLDVHNGSTWQTNVWTKNGQQHTSNAAPWSNAVVDLSAYAGNSNVILRFRTKNTQWNSADPAIDNIRLTSTGSTPYDQWAATAFAGAPGGTDTTATGNPDGDAFSNKIEWALNTNPMVSDSPPMNLSTNGLNFTVTYDRRDVLITGINVHAAWTDSLESPLWRLNGDGMTEVSLGWNGEIQTMQATVPIDAARKFVRIQASE